VTVIVAARDPRGGVVIGSDSQTTNADDFCQKHTPKWATHGDWAIAGAGYHRGVNLVNWNIEELVRGLPPHPASMRTLEQRLRDMMAADGWRIGLQEAKRDDGYGPTWSGHSFVVCNSAGLIYYIAPDRAVIRCPSWMTDGNGQKVAAGAMFALWTAVEQGRVLAEDAVKVAVAAAMELMDGCGGENRVRRLWAPEQRRAAHEETDGAGQAGEGRGAARGQGEPEPGAAGGGDAGEGEAGEARPMTAVTDSDAA
jgi:hypothetical protein